MLRQGVPGSAGIAAGDQSRLIARISRFLSDIVEPRYRAPDRIDLVLTFFEAVASFG